MGARFKELVINDGGATLKRVRVCALVISEMRKLGDCK